MKKKDVILALDFPGKAETLSFLDLFPAGEKPFVKIGMELFYAEGPDIVRTIRARGHRIFLDLKLHDIPNTVRRTMARLARLDVDMVNLHAAGGSAMMRAALEGLAEGSAAAFGAKSTQTGGVDASGGSGKKRPLLIAVTQLTSTDAYTLKNELLIDTPMEQTVLSYARTAARAGLDGVVCSPLEAAAIKKHSGASFLTVTPGIRFAEKADTGAARRVPAMEAVERIVNAGDQKRIMTPERAAKAGCDYLVVGRPITQASAPLSAYRRCRQAFTGF